MTTVNDLLHQRPTNPVQDPGYTTQSDKEWAKSYEPIRNISVRTTCDGEGYSEINKNFLLPWYEDDDSRIGETAVPPNPRQWRFESEADCELWFNTEVSNIVLAAFNQYPAVLQSSHIKPPRPESISQEVDSTYTVKFGQEKITILIGEMKRNRIQAGLGQQGNISSSMSQSNLSRELRGYAVKYQCPQVFCFDGATLLLLQFRAGQEQDMEKADCEVDCCVLPRELSRTTMRFALYLWLRQGLRRAQTKRARQLTVGGLSPQWRQFYDGQPVWRGESRYQIEHPGGYKRSVDLAHGR